MTHQYNPQEIEPNILQFWDREKIFKFDPKRSSRRASGRGEKNIFSIDMPPPTVSGKMHIGHAFSYSQQDFIARFQRMKSNVLYPFGTDDNGLPTERLVEKLKNVRSKSMSRAEFIKLCLATLKEITPTFIQDWKNIGVSADYDLIYSTIDDNSRKISQKSFIDLYKKELVYIQQFPTIWCPECQTAIAQAELEDKEKETQFITIQFSEKIKAATTRPELLGACRAIFVHPTDTRYKKLVGGKIKVPLYNHEVPIISDESADKEKGTGMLLICSYGDKFDVENIKKHKLSPKIIFTGDGKLKDERYADLKIKEARKKIVEDLEKENFITEKKIIKHIVNVHDKCGTEIEFLPTEQWFIKILDKKDTFIAESKKIHWHPEHMQKRYENWVKGLEWDWSISRERHFGIPIPCWHCKACKKIILADEKNLPVDPMQIKKKCPSCNIEAKAEEKVLDTWATSSLTPFITNNLVGNSLKLPFSLRPQAHDIIRTWAFYTIVRSLYAKNKIPWENIMISGFVTLDGEKMSKSKGNVIAPQTVIQQYGADALRFWTAGSKLGEDLDYQEKDVVTGKKLLNKLWNATNFVFMNMPKIAPKKPKKLEKIDELFLIKLNQLIKHTTENFQNYEYAKAKQDVEKFFWSFCDNYLEIIKKRMYNQIGEKKESAQYVIYQSLLTLIKLFAPFIPFITEHIYQHYFRKNEKDKSIHLSSWPKSDQKYHKGKTNKLDSLLHILAKIRQEKSMNKKPMNAEIILHLPKKDFDEIKELQQDLKDVTNAQEIKEGKELRIKFI